MTCTRCDALVAALEAITSWPLGDAGGMRTVAREALSAHHSGVAGGEPKCKRCHGDGYASCQCVPDEPPATSAEGRVIADLRAKLVTVEQERDGLLADKAGAIAALRRREGRD